MLVPRSRQALISYRIILGPCLPNLGITPTVKYCRYHDLLWLDFRKNRVWKTPYHSATNILEHLCIQLRSSTEPVQNLLYMFDELHAEPRPLLLVPIERFVELEPGFRPQDNRQTHRRALAKA